MPSRIKCFIIQIIKLIKGSPRIEVFASRNNGKKINIKMLILAIILSSNFEIIKASKNANMQKGVKILYSNIPRNLLE